MTAEKCWGGLGRINHGVHSLHADLLRKDGLLTRSGTSSKAEEHLKLPIRQRREMRPLHNKVCFIQVDCLLLYKVCSVV